MCIDTCTIKQYTEWHYNTVQGKKDIFYESGGLFIWTFANIQKML